MAPAAATTQKKLPPDTVAYSTPPEKLEQRRRSLASFSPSSRLGAAALLAACAPVWALLVAETLLRAWRKGSLYAALAPPRDPDALEDKRAAWPFPTREFAVAAEGGKTRLACVELVGEDAGAAPDDDGGDGDANTTTPPPDRRPIALFLSGFPEQPFSWRHVMPAVARKGYRCVALASRGYYPSDAPEGVLPYHLRRLADDVRDAALALQKEQQPQSSSSSSSSATTHQLPKVTLVAHDWGGSVAWAAAHLHRDVFGRLIILALPPIQLASANFTLSQSLKSLYILRFQFPWLPEATLLEDDARVVGEVFSAPGIGCVSEGAVTEADKAVYRHAFAQPGRATAALNYYRALMRWNLSRALPWLFGAYADEGLYEAMRQPLDATPVLLFHGDQDVALGTQLLDGWEAVCAHRESRAYLLGRCSHWIPIDRPQAVNELIGGWLPAKG
jgi:epoxide hydrolase 4